MEDEVYTFEKGAADAARDIRAGKLMIRKFGLRASVTGTEEAALLEKEYGIETHALGCLIPYNYADYADGYNETAGREIRRRFGDDYLEKALAKAAQ